MYNWPKEMNIPLSIFFLLTSNLLISRIFFINFSRASNERKIFTLTEIVHNKLFNLHLSLFQNRHLKNKLIKLFKCKYIIRTKILIYRRIIIQIELDS